MCVDERVHLVSTCWTRWKTRNKYKKKRPAPFWDQGGGRWTFFSFFFFLNSISPFNKMKKIFQRGLSFLECVSKLVECESLMRTGTHTYAYQQQQISSVFPTTREKKSNFNLLFTCMRGCKWEKQTRNPKMGENCCAASVIRHWMKKKNKKLRKPSTLEGGFAAVVVFCRLSTIFHRHKSTEKHNSKINLKTLE